MSDISTSLKSPGMKEAIELESPIIIVSGVLSYTPVLLEASEYLAGAIAKSTGPEPRPGNEPPIFHADPWGAFCINAAGLPNQGYKNLADELEEDYPRFQEKGKKLFVSVFANNRRDLGKIVRGLKERFDLAELNVSCPNIKRGERIGVYVGKRPRLIRDYTRTVKNNTDKPVAVKISPDPYIFDRDGLFIDTIEAALEGGADIISGINTVSGGMKIDPKSGVYELTAKYGGVSGRGINPIAVGCIRTIYETVKDRGIPIIGCGGIERPEDVIEMVRVGADAVGIGSVLRGKEADAMNRYTRELISGLRNYLEMHGLGDLMDLKGVVNERV